MNKDLVLIIEDERIVAENLSDTIARHIGIECHIVDNDLDAISFFNNNHVVLIISDINLYGNLSGPVIVQQLLARKIVPVIYLTAYSEDQIVQAALDTNPVAYVLKPYLERQLLIAVKMALQKDESTDSDEKTLTPKPREIEIIQLIAEGLSSKKIAEKLFISSHTVSTHRKNMLKRYRMETTVELVAFAIKNKWIKL